MTSQFRKNTFGQVQDSSYKKRPEPEEKARLKLEEKIQVGEENGIQYNKGHLPTQFNPQTIRSMLSRRKRKLRYTNCAALSKFPSGR